MLKLINVASNQLYEIVKKIYKNKLKILKKKFSSRKHMEKKIKRRQKNRLK